MLPGRQPRPVPGEELRAIAAPEGSGLSAHGALSARPLVTAGQQRSDLPGF